MGLIDRIQHNFYSLCCLTAGLFLFVQAASPEEYLDESVKFTLRGHDGPIYSVSFSPDGSKALTSSQDTKLKVWDTSTGVVLLDLDREYYVLDGAISIDDTDGQRLLTGDSDGLASFWYADTGTFVRAFIAHTQRLSTVSYSPNAKWFVTGSYDNTVKVWDADTWSYETVVLKSTFSSHTDNVSSAAFSPDSTMVVTGSWDKTAKLWYAQTGVLIADFTGHTSSIFSVDFSTTGTQVMTGSGEPDNTAALWSWSGGTVIRDGTFVGHTAAVNSVAFSPDGDQVATGSSDGSLKIWDKSTHKEILSFDDPNNPIHSIAYSPDGDHILAGYENDTAILRWLGPSMKVLVHDNFNSNTVSDATVTISIGITKQTDTQGETRFRFLPAGEYTVEVSKSGYQTKSATAVISKATSTLVDIGLLLDVPPNIFTSAFPLAETGVYYEEKVNVKGGIEPFKFIIAYGKLPFGMTLNEDTGVISGTPTVSAHYLFGLGLTDAQGLYTEKEFTIEQVDPLTFSTSERLPNGALGEYYSTDLHVSGGVAPYVVDSVTGVGAMPSGLTIDATGTISGTPTLKEIATFDAIVTDLRNKTFQKTFTLEIFDVLTVDIPQLRDGMVSYQYNETLEWSGGNYTGPYQWEIYSGNLPAGLSLVQDASQTWRITGVPEDETFQTIVLSVTDMDGRVAYKSFLFRIVYPLDLVISRDALPTGGVGYTYSEIIPIRGGIPPFSFSYVGDLPAGLVLFSTQEGVISGAPTTVQLNNIDVTVTDGSYPDPQVAVKTVGIRITSDLMIRTSRKIQTGVKDVTVAPVALNAAGGPTPYRWTLVGGFLPPGINLNYDSGQLTGIPTQTGDYYFTIEVEDAKGNTAQKEFLWPIKPLLKVLNKSSYEIAKDRDFFLALDASGGIEPYNWSVSGTLPPGLVFDASAGTIHGKPTVNGSSIVTVSVSDSDIPAQNVQKVSFPITLVTKSSFILFTQQIPDGRIGENYSTSLRSYYGQWPYQWEIESGSLPSGLILKNSSTSVAWIEGVPDAVTPADSTFTIAVSDTSTPPVKLSREFNIIINSQVQLETTILRKWLKGIPYSHFLEVSGGLSPYAWDVVLKKLPNGFSLNPNTGELSGMPSEELGQSTEFAIRVSDSGIPLRSDSKTFTLELVDEVEILTDSTLSMGMVNQDYTVTFEGHGGMAPYEWIVVNQNTLPPGLSLNSANGTLSGSPTVDGIYNFTIFMFDSSQPSKSDSNSFTIQVLPLPVTPTPTPTITPTPIPGASPTPTPTITPVPPTDVPVITRTLSKYRSPGEYRVSLDIQMKGIVTSLGVQETLPENWTYAGSSQTPVRSGGREIEWDYSVGVDETLTYTVVIPSGQVGDKNFSGVFFYTLNGDQITLEIDGSTVAIPIEHHSADYNKDWSISIDEIVYAARLYNVEAYYIGEGQDGYTTVISGRDSFPHSADLNQDWNIILDEIVYTARLYNAQSYKIGDGDDGYTAVNASGKRIGRRNVAVEPVKCVRTVKDGIDPGVVIVSLALESSEISSGLGVIEAFPESWQVVSVSPASSQQRGHRIEWFFPNAGDYSIEYSLNTNGNRTGSEAFSGQVIYTAGDEIVKENTLTANEDSTDVAYWMVY